MNSRLTKQSFRNVIILPCLMMAFSSCAVMENQSEAESAPVPSPSVVTGQITTLGSQAEANAIAVLDTAAADEQRALIAEINTDGERTEFTGLTETAPEPVSVSGENVVELNYEQASLQLVLEELADALDITIVMDPTISEQISIRTAENRPLAREDIWPLIRLLTRDAGIVLNRVGNVYNARKVSGSAPTDIVTPETMADGNSARMMQITPLVYVSSTAAIEVLSPILEPEGNISRLANTSLLAITGSEAQLERVNQLLILIDADPFANQGIQLFQLLNASATEVATELTEIISLIEGSNPSFQVKGIERINSVLVTAPATRGFEDISRWIKILDADSQEQVEQLFQYRVRNLSAVELATTLSSAFEVEEEAPISVLAAQQNALQAAPQLLVPTLGPDGQIDVVATTEPAAADAGSANSGAVVSANLTVKIVADAATNSLLIRSTARDYRQLLTIISQLDAVPLQVMINAVIAQITLTDNTRFGVDWTRVANQPTIDPISTNTSTSFLPPAGLSGFLFSKTFLDGAARVEATLEAIAVNNEVSLLARPSLTVINNQEGEIQIGSQVPVEQGQTIGVGGQATSNIVYRDTGIILAITPQINDDGIVNLTITQSLSSVDNGAGGVNGNPVFNNQEISTTVVVRNGENVVLGGLIQTVEEDLNTGVPILNQLPVLGGLFSYQEKNEERRELFIVLRPEVIDLNAEVGPEYGEIISRFDMIDDLFQAAAI